MRQLLKMTCLLAILLIAAGASTLWADWVDDGVPVSTAAIDQMYPQIASDGAGGAIITWFDCRDNWARDIYAQRVDESGVVQWTSGGIGVCTAAWDQDSPQIVPDGAGGAIITWADLRNAGYSNIYAQRVNGSGAPQWTPDGVAICTGSSAKVCPQLVSDGAGGAIITWYDGRALQWDIYAQHVNASGVIQWPAAGVAVATGIFDELDPQITTDGAGGAIIAWRDYRVGEYDIYAQRINSSGSIEWTTNGIPICTVVDRQMDVQIISDGSGGAIMAWDDLRGGDYYDIYAQRVNGSGVVQWTTGGVAVSTAVSDQMCPQLAPDGSGGAIVTWEDYVSDMSWDIYAQRVDSNGATVWTVNGIPVCAAASFQRCPQVISDGAGGAIITWHDFRSEVEQDIYAQRLNGAGVAQWTPDGLAVCTATGQQYNPELAPDGDGGAIITWFDYRSGSDADVYAQRVLASMVDVPPASVASDELRQNVPNPFNPLTSITFSVATPGQVKLSVCDISGRVLRTLVDGWLEMGVHYETWDGRGEDGIALPSGVYLYSLEAGPVKAARKMVLLQ